MYCLTFHEKIPYVSSAHIMNYKRLYPDCFIILEAELKTSLDSQRTDSQLKHHFITPT